MSALFTTKNSIDSLPKLIGGSKSNNRSRSPKNVKINQKKNAKPTSKKKLKNKTRKRRIKRQRSPLLNKKKEILLSNSKSKQTIKRQLPPLRIVVLDNDECMGQFGFLSLFHQIPFHIKGNPVIKREDLVRTVSKYILGGGACRPYAKKLLQHLHSLKKQNKIDAVVMYTSASNTAGYVHFLKDCLEFYANTPGVYDDVIHYHSVRSVRANDGATRKDFKNVLLRLLERRGICGPFPRNLVQEATRNIIMFDDRPHNINSRGGTVEGVKQYCRTIPKKNVLYLIEHTPNYKNVEGVEQLEDELYEDWDEFEEPDSLKQKKYDRDTELKNAINKINIKFNI
tara:strand:+ start:218 stop:1237 length:1020 start_codon:yes stop_codon:yes gene_type:complete